MKDRKKETIRGLFRWHENITLLNCREEETGVALINLKVERARRRASLADRFLRGVTQFLDVFALGAVSFRKIHEPDEPSRQYPLWVMTPGPWQRNAGRGREEGPFHRSFHWLRSNMALLAFFFRLASTSRSFKRENGLTNDDDESSSPSPPPSSSSAVLSPYRETHLSRTRIPGGCESLVGFSPLLAHIIYITNLSRVPSAILPILSLFLCHTKLALLFSLLSSESNPGRGFGPLKDATKGSLIYYAY